MAGLTAHLKAANRKLQKEIQKRQRIEESLRQAHSLLHATLNSTADGILVVDRRGKIVSYNRRFLELWRIPESLAALGNDARLIEFVLDELKNPEHFVANVKQVYSHPEAESYDVLEFKDGRAFERYSRPQKIGRKIVGRAWSFRDVTKSKAAEDTLRESQESYKELAESIDDVFFAMDRDLKVIYWNKACESLFGASSRDAIGKSLGEFLPSEASSTAETVSREVLRTQQPKCFVNQCMTDESELFHEVSVYPSKHGLSVFVKDISERMQAEKRLAKLNECFLNFGADQDQNINLLVALCGEELGADTALYNRLDQGLLRSLGQWNVPAGFNPVDKADGHVCYDVIRGVQDETCVIRNLPGTVYAQTDPNVLRYGLKTYVGKRVSLGSEHVGSVCVLYKEDHTPREKDLELLGIAATAIAVEEKRRHAEEMMRASEQRYRSLFQRNLAGVYRTMLDGRIMDCNDSFARVFGYTCREEVLSHLACNLYKSVEDRKAFTSRLQEKHTVTNLEGSLLRKDGNPVWVLENASLVNDEDGTPLIEGTLIDITERKLAEEQIKASLKEKEVLLKEIHHRVKNNMQVISSLLSLQANRAGSQEVVDMFRESQNRVKSMALIHEKLYQSGDLARIDLGEYIRNLAGNLFRTYNVRNVALEMEVEDIHFGVDTAIPCGLIINELISNSLKHAFPDGMSGRLFIGMHHTGANMYRLQVKDDGIGFPDNVSFQATESLGLQLVMTLTQQLHGEIDLDKNHGTSFSIAFEVKHEGSSSSC